MPKKTASKAKKVQKSTKKVATKKKSAAPVKRTVSTSSSSVWSKKYLHAEQESFYKDHPNARNLIATFILLSVSFLVLYIVPMMR